MIVRIGSAFGSFIGNLIAGTLLLAGLQANWCGDLACRTHAGIPMVYLQLPRWTPWIDAQTAGDPSDDEEPRCPAAAAWLGTVRLDEAPLPAGFDPNGRKVDRLVACVRLDGHAQVMAAYLLPGSGTTAMDAALLRQIRRDWRFSGPDGNSGGWQRVRLSTGATARPLKPIPQFPSSNFYLR